MGAQGRRPPGNDAKDGPHPGRGARTRQAGTVLAPLPGCSPWRRIPVVAPLLPRDHRLPSSNPSGLEKVEACAAPNSSWVLMKGLACL
jgi:hypothetical protein